MMGSRVAGQTSLPAAVQKPSLHIVLVQPRIPQNSGSIGRLCLGLGAALHLVKPLGFELSNARVKRAGLDYWPRVDLRQHESWAACECHLKKHASVSPAQTYFFSKYGTQSLLRTSFYKGDPYLCIPSPLALVFGSETSGLPVDVKHSTTFASGERNGRVLTLPMFARNSNANDDENDLNEVSNGERHMHTTIRSHNLSCSVAMAAFEALRQQVEMHPQRLDRYH